MSSRNTPNMILELMRDIAYALANKGWILRTGQAQGADNAFERGANYWAWKKNDFKSVIKEIYLAKDSTPTSIALAHECFEFQKVDHIWRGLASYVQELHGRNMQQVLGYSLDKPVRAVICWTPDGVEDGSKVNLYTGGTRTAIWCAWKMKIPVINLNRAGRVAQIREKLSI